MAFSYSDIDRSKIIYQPNFSRARHRYRGDRESAKINLEISQFTYDVNNIYKKTNTSIETNARYVSYIEYGLASDEFTHSSTGDGTVDGLKSVYARLEGLRNRVLEMEKRYV